MRLADDGRFRNSGVTDQGAFHFSRTEPIARDFNHVIGTTHEPHIAIGIFMTDITGGVAIRDRVPVSLIPLGILVDRAHHGRPRLLDDGKPSGVSRETVALAIDNIGLNSKKWACG